MNKLKIVKKIISVVCTVLLIALVAVAVISSIISKRTNKPAFIFGYSLLWVKTGSMEPTIPERSYVLVKNYDGNGVQEGDIITFICPDPASPVYGQLITHRVQFVVEGGYKTKGDNSFTDTFTVKDENIVGVYADNLPVFTFFGRIFLSSVGFMLIAALFVAVVAFLYMPDIVKAFSTEQEKVDKNEIIEQKIREQVEKMCEEDAKKSKK